MSTVLPDTRIWSGIDTQKLVNSANEYEAKLPNDAKTRDLVIRIRREIARRTKVDKAAQRMAFADHIYASSEPEDTMTAEDRKEQLEPDYEPEQAYGTADDFRRHRQYGGTREDY